MGCFLFDIVDAELNEDLGLLYGGGPEYPYDFGEAGPEGVGGSVE